MIFEEQFPVPRYTAASKIGNSVISLLWQLRCRCNPDHNKFSSLSNTTVVSIFPNLCLWRRSLRSNLGGIDLEKLHRATLMLTEWPGMVTVFEQFFHLEYSDTYTCNIHHYCICHSQVTAFETLLALNYNSFILTVAIIGVGIYSTEAGGYDVFDSHARDMLTGCQASYIFL